MPRELRSLPTHCKNKAQCNKCADNPSSVARGGEEGGATAPLNGLKSMQNSMFLVLLRPIFAPKMKTAPTNGIWELKLWRTWRYLDQNSGGFLFWSSPKIREDLFFFFFWRSPNFGRKDRLNFGEDLFFWDYLILTEKPPQTNSWLMKIWVKFVYRSFKLPKKPPLCEILATRLDSKRTSNITQKFIKG